MMKTNWLWDSKVKEPQVRRILKDSRNARFYIYATKLLSRVQDPEIAFSYMPSRTFVSHWAEIKDRMVKDAWARQQVSRWQHVYAKIHKSPHVRQERRIRQIQEPATPQVQLASQIRMVRKERGWSQNDVALRLGVIQQYVSRIESGRENMTLATLQKVSKVLGRRVQIRLA
jgi:DNA-binding XRE family transcriptional regulator